MAPTTTTVVDLTCIRSLEFWTMWCKFKMRDLKLFIHTSSKLIICRGQPDKATALALSQSTDRSKYMVLFYQDVLLRSAKDSSTKAWSLFSILTKSQREASLQSKLTQCSKYFSPQCQVPTMKQAKEAKPLLKAAVFMFQLFFKRNAKLLSRFLTTSNKHGSRLIDPARRKKKWTTYLHEAILLQRNKCKTQVWQASLHSDNNELRREEMS